ncbi:MAG: B12-binding domain-containing radical SAM protein [Crenarchaeota archaeon]|nr:B12-binding domain-containing radical SAM protein [Thermoproteota archaeon]
MRDVIKISVCGKKIREYNPLHKHNPRRAPSVALLYPAPYSVASQSLGYQLLYAYFIAHGIRVERFTYDSCGLSLERSTPLKKFDVIVASSSFELDYPYLADYVRKHGREGQRLVVGGIAPTANPVPLLDLADHVVLGDAEPVVGKLAEAVSSGDWEGFASSEHVVSPGDLSGKKAVADLRRSPALAKQFVPLDVEPPWGRGFLVEVTRGCPWKCRFCLEGWVGKPFRQRSLSQVRDLLNSIEGPYEKIITISLSLGDYEHAEEYLHLLASSRLTGSVPSMRLERLTRSMLIKIKKIGQKTLTVAPETLVPEKAEVLGKGYDAQFFLKKISEIKEVGLKVKAYMMVLPGEPERATKEDVERLAEAGPHHVSVNPLVPKPWTPLQGAPLPTEREERLALLFKERFRYADVYPVRWARLQAAIGLARRPLARELEPRERPEDALRKLNEKGLISLRELGRWRLEWDEPWLELGVGDLGGVKRAAEESYEAWKRLVSS